MKWQEDLVKDIRFHDYRDDLDYPVDKGNFIFEGLGIPRMPFRPKKIPDFSSDNQLVLKTKLEEVKNQTKTILEIGVSRDRNFDKTSTSIFINHKNSDCFYFGVDIEDKSYLKTKGSLVFPIQTGSQNIDEVMEIIKSTTGKETIDFLFIDGWHSINQVLIEWEYTKFLSATGVIIFHDTAYHPGPYYFINNLDKNKWHVIENACSDINIDHGLGVVWKK